MKFKRDKTKPKEELPIIGGGTNKGSKSANINPKRLMVLVLIIATVTSLVAGSLYYYNQTKTNEEESVGQVIPSQEDLFKKIEDEKDPEEKAKLYGQLSEVQQIEEDYIKAQETAEQAVESDPGVGSYSLLAGTAEQNGEWAVAAEYYQKAVDLSEPVDDPDINNDYNYYTQKVREMRAKL